MDKIARRQHWSGILEEQGASGLSKKAFCADRDINAATFYYWQRRLSELSSEEESMDFHEILPVHEHELSLSLFGGEVVMRSCSLAVLGRVLQALADA